MMTKNEPIEYKIELPRIRELISNGLRLSQIEASDVKRIVRALKSDAFIESDCPDGYFIDWKSDCIIFEHFEIDASKKSRKGSAAKNKRAEFERAVNDEIKEESDTCK
jgi:hypothetical protein